MILYIDTESRKLVQSLSSDRIAPSPQFMQGDNEPLEIHLLQRGTATLYEDKILNPTEDFLRIGVTRFKGDPKLLTIASTYEPLENGGAIIMLPLNTVEIESALGNNPSLDAYLEIEYSTLSGRIITVLQTPCKVKNDLIEDSPNVEIQAQFFTKEQTEILFLKKSDNLESLSDKALSRQNLEVHSKDENDNFVKILNEKDYELSRKLNTFASFTGIYSDYGFSYYGPNSSDTIGGDVYETIEKFTILLTYLSHETSTQICAGYNSYDNYISIDDNGNSVNFGSIYDENYNQIYFKCFLSKQILYGDKIALTLENRTIKIYKNADLVGEYFADERLKFYNPQSLFNYKGHKKDFAFSNNFALPHTRDEGAGSSYKYSVEQWANNEPIPFNLLYNLFTFSKPNYTTKLGSGNYLETAAPRTYLGVNNCQIIYLTTTAVSQRAFAIFGGSTTATLYYPGVYFFTAKICIPANNTKIKKLQLKLGSLTFKNSSAIEIISASGIDADSYITSLDTWVEVKIKFRWKANNAVQAPTIVPCTATNSTQLSGVGNETNERFYIANTSIESLEGISAYYNGGVEFSKWKDKTKNGYDINLSYQSGLVSYPPDSVSTFSKKIKIEDLAYGYYNYSDEIPQNFEIAYAVFKPDKNIPDTSNAENDYDKNYLRMGFSGGGYNSFDLLLPSMIANTAYILYPQFGTQDYTSYIYIENIYNLNNVGATITFYFNKKP